MAATWPTDFPSPEFANWQLEPAPLTIRSEMEAGPARVRRISTQRNDTVAVTWVLSREQFAQFRTWYSADAKDGAEWFDAPMQAGQGTGECETTERCRFIGHYQAAAVNERYIRISAELEIR